MSEHNNPFPMPVKFSRQNEDGTFNGSDLNGWIANLHVRVLEVEKQCVQKRDDIDDLRLWRSSVEWLSPAVKELVNWQDRIKGMMWLVTSISAVLAWAVTTFWKK